MPAALLVFDGDCAFCSSAVERLRSELPLFPRAVPWQCLDLGELGLTTRDVDEHVWLIDPASGRRWKGAEALGALLAGQRETLHRVTGGLLLAPVVRDLAACGYRRVAANRHRLPGGTPACAMPPAARGA